MILDMIFGMTVLTLIMLTALVQLPKKFKGCKVVLGKINTGMNTNNVKTWDIVFVKWFNIGTDGVIRSAQCCSSTNRNGLTKLLAHKPQKFVGYQLGSITAEGHLRLEGAMVEADLNKLSVFDDFVDSLPIITELPFEVTNVHGDLAKIDDREPFDAQVLYVHKKGTKEQHCIVAEQRGEKFVYWTENRDDIIGRFLMKNHNENAEIKVWKPKYSKMDVWCQIPKEWKDCPVEWKKTLLPYPIGYEEESGEESEEDSSSDSSSESEEESQPETKNPRKKKAGKLSQQGTKASRRKETKDDDAAGPSRGWGPALT